MTEITKRLLIPLIILNVIIILISLYLSFLFIKSKAFKTYPCYNMILISFVVLIDNILRIIPFNRDEDCNIFEKIEAFFLVFFDKLILATISMQALIFYLGVLKNQFYSSNEKKIFFITLIISLVISCTLSGLYVGLFGAVPAGLYCYCGDDSKKSIIDSIFNAVYLAINFYCTLIVMLYCWRKKNEAALGMIDDSNESYKHNFKRVVIMFIINNIAFIESYLIIYDVLPYDSIDLIYLITCLGIDLFNCINETVYKETLKIFCIKKYREKYPKIKSSKTRFDDDDDDEGKRNDSFESN